MSYKNLINLKQTDNSSSLSSDSAVAGSGKGALAADAGVCGLALRLQRGRRWQQAGDAAVEQLLGES